MLEAFRSGYGDALRLAMAQHGGLAGIIVDASIDAARIQRWSRCRVFSTADDLRRAIAQREVAG